MNKKILTSCLTLLLTATALTFTGCAPKLGGSDYSVNEVGSASTTLYGVIVNMRNININNGNSGPNAGAAIGGVSGAVLGSTIGKGSGSIVTAVVGGLAGALAGQFAEQGLTNQVGFEYTVQLDNGQMMTIAQGAEPKMSNGQKVAVIMNKTGAGGNQGRSRVVPA